MVLHHRLLVDLTKTVGFDHPDTLALRRDLAEWHGKAGDTAKAVAQLEDLLPDLSRVLGTDHPGTRTTRRDLVFGPDHPDTMTVERSYGAWDGRAGQTRYATLLFGKLYQRRLRVRGADHPDTIAARRDDDLYHLMASNKIDPHPFDSGIEDTLQLPPLRAPTTSSLQVPKTAEPVAERVGPRAVGSRPYGNPRRTPLSSAAVSIGGGTAGTVQRASRVAAAQTAG